MGNQVHDCIEIRVFPVTYLYLALLLLILPVRWVVACIAAAIIHELGHIAAIKLLGIQVDGILISITGAVIKTANMEPWQELVSALAGPLCGFLLIFAGKYLPLTALCACCQSLFNLFPLYPSDGGRALQSLLLMAFPQATAIWVCAIIQKILLTFLILWLLCMTFRFSMGILPVAIPFAVAAKYGI